MVRLAAGRFYGSTVTARDARGLNLFETVYQRRLRNPQHSHEYASLCLVLRGQFTEYSCGREINCSPLTALYYPAGVSHGESFDAPLSHCFIVEIPQSWCHRLGCALPGAPIHARGGALAEISGRMFRESRSRDQVSALALEGLGLELIAAAARQQLHKREVSARLERVREAIHAGFRESVSISDLASVAGLRPATLAIQFRMHFGCTPAAYLRRLRVEFAMKLLAETAEPIANIAPSAGFCDQAHLCRVFRRRVGVSPGEFRQAVAPPRTSKPK